MNNFEKTLAEFDYEFPNELIAQTPAHPRDTAKLLVYDRATRELTHDAFKNLVEHLPEKAVLVLNQTKVLPARLEVTKPTGGKARILYVGHDNKLIKALCDRKLEPGSTLTINKSLALSVAQQSDQIYLLRPHFPMSKLVSVLEQHGITPLPPYIKHPGLSGKKLLAEYNTVFAKTTGSVAAPTASLHFTKSLLKRIEQKGIKIKYVTLHVNLGTFASLTEEQVKSKKLHQEHYEIDKATARFLNKVKANGQPIIAVGTTVVRTLESASNAQGLLTKLTGETMLFLTEKSRLRFVDQLITNFHVPKSSLLMLVSALVGRKQLLALYSLAIKLKYRLFSFGDGMYIK